MQFLSPRGNEVLSIICKDQSMASDFSTIPLECTVFDMGCMQAVWSGVSTSALSPGKIFVEGSVDGENWCRLFSDQGTKKITTAAGCTMYDIERVSMRYMRVTVEKNSNSGGIITCYFFLKRRRSVDP